MRLTNLLCLLLLAAPLGAQDKPKNILHDELVLSLATADIATMTLDYRNTLDFAKRGEEPGAYYRETDPLLRPFVHNAPAMYSQEAIEVVGLAFLGHKMHTSHRRWVRDIAWVPQTFSIGESAWGYGFSRAHWKR